MVCKHAYSYAKYRARETCTINGELFRCSALRACVRACVPYYDKSPSARASAPARACALLLSASRTQSFSRCQKARAQFSRARARSSMLLPPPSANASLIAVYATLCALRRRIDSERMAFNNPLILTIGRPRVRSGERNSAAVGKIRKYLDRVCVCACVGARVPYRFSRFAVCTLKHTRTHSNCACMPTPHYYYIAATAKTKHIHLPPWIRSETRKAQFNTHVIL